MNYKCVSSMQKIILLMIIAYLHLINLSNKLNISWDDVLIQFVFIKIILDNQKKCNSNYNKKKYFAENILHFSDFLQHSVTL